jgi:hypothetical protein
LYTTALAYSSYYDNIMWLKLPHAAFFLRRG